jgi:hypothetical protein
MKGKLLCAIAWSGMVLGSIVWAAGADSPAPGGAGTAEVPALEGVTVTAPRPPTPEELAGEAVPNFITSHITLSAVIHQMTRWRLGVCPQTLGLSQGFNAFVTARILAVAAAVGAPPPEGEPCKPNVRILFTLEPQRVLDEIVKQDAKLLGFHYSSQTKKLATFSRPIQGMYITSTRNARGIEAIDDPLPLPALPGIMYAGSVPPGELGSRLTTGRTSNIVMALIVVDAKIVSGMPIGPIADYLAMMTLSQAKSPDTCGQLPSIVDLLASNCGNREKPSQITAGDIAFLRGLYSLNVGEPDYLQSSDIQNKMMREFAGR